jgi:hypothetical protein
VIVHGVDFAATEVRPAAETERNCGDMFAQLR